MAGSSRGADSIFDINLRTGTVVRAWALMLAIAIIAASAVQAQTFTVLHQFGYGHDGYEPLAGVTLDTAGNLYGTTTFGGSEGTVYKLGRIGSGWVYSKLYGFSGSDGEFPIAKLAIGRDGSLYGTTTAGGKGGSGVAFNLRPPPTRCVAVQCLWQLTVLHSFTYSYEGTSASNLNFDSAGNLFGTTADGGPGGLGTVYKLTPSGGSWTYTMLTNFEGTGAGAPYGGVIPDQNGNVYGTGYDTYPGTVFEVTSSGAVQVLHKFHSSDGLDPFYGLIFGPQGNLYGETAFGGASGEGGTVFELAPSGGGWSFSLLYSFPGIINNGAIGNASLSMDAEGNLYGTTFGNGTYNYGTVFKLTPSPSGWIYTDLHDFTGGDDGCYPWSDVSIDKQGNLYGTASACGQNGFSGTVWEITP